jgi:hypothetical protein
MKESCKTQKFPWGHGVRPTKGISERKQGVIKLGI